MHTAQDIEQAIRAEANPDKVKTLSGFFKTGKGEYGEQDIFIGIPVPMTRSIVKQYLDTPLDQLEILLHNPIHELRMAALLCMVEQFKKADAQPSRSDIPHLFIQYRIYQQLGFGRFIRSINRRRLSRRTRPHPTLSAGPKQPHLGTAHFDCLHLAMDPQRPLRRYARYCRYSLVQQT